MAKHDTKYHNYAPLYKISYYHKTFKVSLREKKTLKTEAKAHEAAQAQAQAAAEVRAAQEDRRRS